MDFGRRQVAGSAVAREARRRLRTGRKKGSPTNPL